MPDAEPACCSHCGKSDSKLALAVGALNRIADDSSDKEPPYEARDALDAIRKLHDYEQANKGVK